MIFQKQKDIYYLFLYPQNVPGSLDKWNITLGRDIDIKCASHNLQQKVSLNKYREFSWKCLHRAIYSEARLKLMNRSNGICKLCNEEEESTLHLLYYCKCINGVWVGIENYLADIIHFYLLIDPYVVLVGPNIGQNEVGKNKMNVINTLIHVTKWEIWKNRNNVKFGNKNSLEVDELLATIIRQYKINLNMFKRNLSPGNKMLNYINELAEDELFAV